MPLDPATLLALAATCAPQVSPQTMLALVRAESGLDPLALGINAPGARAAKASDLDTVVAEATRWMGAGHSVDLGLTQINSRNLGPLGLTVRSALEPCRNLAAGARVLQDGYRRAGPAQRGEQIALRIALSYYNTGDPERGWRNGYVGKVLAAAGQSTASQRPPAPRPSVRPPTWDVFARARDAAAAPRPILILSPGDAS